jgi:DNA-binding NarL/FixJ family response regulator
MTATALDGSVLHTPLLTEFTTSESDAKSPNEVLDVLQVLAAKFLPISVLGAARMPLQISDWRSTRIGRDAFLHSSVLRLLHSRYSLALGAIDRPRPAVDGETGRDNSARAGVLRLVSAGRVTDEIAELLGLGKETVRSHLKKVQSKLGVRNRTQAVAEAIRQQLIP